MQRTANIWMVAAAAAVFTVPTIASAQQATHNDKKPMKNIVQVAVEAGSFNTLVAAVKAALSAPNYLLKIIPHVDGTARICELVEYFLEDVNVKGAWTGPAALELHAHALAPVTDLPVLEVLSGLHILSDLTLGLGKVVHDYLG